MVGGRQSSVAVGKVKEVLAGQAPIFVGCDTCGK